MGVMQFVSNLSFVSVQFDAFFNIKSFMTIEDSDLICHIAKGLLISTSVHVMFPPLVCNILTFIETLFVLLHSCGHLLMLHVHIFVSDNLYMVK
jgi:hypothetical protein